MEEQQRQEREAHEVMMQEDDAKYADYLSRTLRRQTR
jgi:hypothetical protein